MSLPTPVAYWPFDEATGTTAADATGNGHTITLNTAGWTTTLQKYGPSALIHVGSSGPPASLTPIYLSTVHTVAFWLNGWDGSSDGIAVGSDPGYYAGYIDATNIYYSAITSNFVTVSHGGGTGLHHWCITRNGGAVKFYKDGAQVGTTQTLGNTSSSFGVDTVLSYNSGANSLQAALDDLHIYDVELSAAQVAELYAGPGGNVTLALTGSHLTSAIGALGVALALGLGGSGVTATAGTVTPTTAHALTGSAIAGSPGSVTPATTRGLTGTAITAAPGTLTASTGCPTIGFPAFDDFERTDTTLGPCYWTQLTGQFATDGTSAVSSVAGGSLALWNETPFPNDQYAAVQILHYNTDQAGPCVRISPTGDASYAMVASQSAATVTLYHTLASVGTAIQSLTGVTLGTGDFLRLEARASTLRMYVNGAQVGTDQADTTIASGQPGLFNYNAATPSASLTFFQADALASQTTIALTGTALTSAVGTLAPSAAVPVTGTPIVSAQGTITAAGNQTIALTGSPITAAQGTLAPASAKALTGSPLTSAVGAVVPSAAVPVTGTPIVSAPGTLTAVKGTQTLALTGSPITAAQGTLAPASAKALTGTALTAAVGAVVPSAAVPVTGTTLVSAQGLIRVPNTFTIGWSAFTNAVITPSGDGPVSH